MSDEVSNRPQKSTLPHFTGSVELHLVKSFHFGNCEFLKLRGVKVQTARLHGNHEPHGKPSKS